MRWANLCLPNCDLATRTKWNFRIVVVATIRRQVISKHFQRAFDQNIQASIPR
jgi:hypothetical protein